MTKELKSIYKTYAEKCKEAKKKPVSTDTFMGVVKKQKKILSYQLSLGCTSPWIISRIDSDFVLYVSTNAGSVTLNVWSNIECEAMTGMKVTDPKI